MLNDTPRTAWTRPSAVGKLTHRSLTSSRLTRPPFGSPFGGHAGSQPGPRRSRAPAGTRLGHTGQGVLGLSQMLVKSQPCSSVLKLAVPVVALLTRLLAYCAVFVEVIGTMTASFMTVTSTWCHSASAADTFGAASARLIRLSTAGLL